MYLPQGRNMVEINLDSLLLLIDTVLTHHTTIGNVAPFILCLLWLATLRVHLHRCLEACGVEALRGERTWLRAIQRATVDQPMSSLMLTALLIGALFPITDHRLSPRNPHDSRLHQQQKSYKIRLESDTHFSRASPFE